MQNAPASLRAAAETATNAVAHAKAWVMATMGAGGPAAVEQGARRFALTLGRAVELGLLIEHATWAEARGDASHSAAARLFARAGVDCVYDGFGSEDVFALRVGQV